MNGGPPLPAEFDGLALQREVRRSHYAVVYAALDREGHPVTVSTPRSWQYREHGPERVRARFEAAVHRLSGLRHDCLLAVIGSGVWEGRPYLVQPRLEGPDLCDLARRRGPLPYTAACAGLAGIVEGVGVLHRASMLHLAISPQMITVAAPNRLVLHDYGVSCPMYAGREGDPVRGAPIFLSPEQLLGKATNVGITTDIYHLGATTYATLTGRAPFFGESLIVLMRAVLKGKVIPPHRLNASIPRKLGKLVVRCLAVERNKRPTDAGELAAALRQFCDV